MTYVWLLLPTALQVAYGWVVKSASDGTPQATATGVSTTILLPRGMYVVILNVVDSTGTSSTTGPVQFTVTGQNSGSYGGGSSSIDPSLAVMLAKIASPPPIVMMAADGGNVSVQLDAAGSSPGPGFVIDQYVWTVTNQQAGNSVVLSQQVVRQVSAAIVVLPVGSYIVSLVVRDTSGRNASIAQVRPDVQILRLCLLMCALQWVFFSELKSTMCRHVWTVTS
jgi:hypothetical protein